MHTVDYATEQAARRRQGGGGGSGGGSGSGGGFSAGDAAAYVALLRDEARGAVSPSPEDRSRYLSVCLNSADLNCPRIPSGEMRSD